MVELEWEGVMKREDCSAAFLARRDEVANAAHDYHWVCRSGRGADWTLLGRNRSDQSRLAERAGGLAYAFGCTARWRPPRTAWSGHDSGD